MFEFVAIASLLLLSICLALIMRLFRRLLCRVPCFDPVCFIQAFFV